MCCFKFFCPSLAATDAWAGNMQFFMDFGTRAVLEDYFFDHPLDIFFNFSFSVPSLKRRLILLFVSVFLLWVTCLLQCFAVITLVRFSVHQFFFCIPTNSSFRLRSIVPIVRCLGGGYCGNTVNSVCCNYIFFLATLFFLWRNEK